MSKKSWYNRTHQFAPYTKADGQAVSDEFDAIQSSFDRIPEMRDDGKGFAVSPIIPTPTDPMHPVTYGMLTEAEDSVAESRKDVTEKAQQVDANTKTVSEKTEIVIEKSDSATQSASAALTSQQSANQSETMAKKWAANPIDEPVVDDKFSAFHYATKAAKSAEILATAESSAKSNAEIATQKAEEAARSADKARNIAGGKVYYEDVLEVPRASINGDVGITTLSSDLYSDSETEAATIGVVKSVWDKVKDQYIESVSHLTSLEPDNNWQLIIVKSYHYNDSTGGGIFIADMTDKTTPDNGGTVIVTRGGNRWKRANNNNLSLYDFGYSNQSNAVEALERAERANLGAFIDCCGLTIDFNNKYPTANKYKNGKFIINGVEVNAQYNSPRTGIGRFISGSKAGEKLKSSEWTGADVIAIGEGAMANMEKCVSSIALGKRAQGTTLISRDNIAIGIDTLYQVQAETEWYSQDKLNGTRNVAIGGAAGRGITSGYSNVAIGRIAGQNLNTGAFNVAIGGGAIGGTVPIGFSGDIEHHFPSSTKESVAVGVNALNQYVADASGVAVGAYAAEKLKKGLYNTAIGWGALRELESDVAPNGGLILWQGKQSGSYTQSENVITLTFSDLHGAEVNSFVGVRLLNGDAKTLLGDIVPAKVLSKSGNTITVDSPKSINTSGDAELCFVYSDSAVGALNTNHNTAIGFAALTSAKRSGFSVAIGAHSLKLGKDVSRTVAIGTSSFERGNHTSSIAIGSHSGNKANTNNAIIIGVSSLTNAETINNSIFIGNNLNPTDINQNNKLAIGDSFTGNLERKRYGVNVPLNKDPLASFHIRSKDDAGNGSINPFDGLLIEHSRVAVAKFDAGDGVDLDFNKNNITKFAFRYRADGDTTTMIVNNEHSWKFNSSHVMFPDKDNRNILGLHSRRIKEINLMSPDANESGDKAVTAKWVRDQFGGNLSGNGWTKLPNGLILQWGSFSSGKGGEFKFPISFNQIPYMVIVKLRDSNINSFASSYTNTGFSLYDNLPRLVTFNMFAIGR